MPAFRNNASILIAAYQAGRFLPGALASVGQQTHPDWELIVVEDGSQDETESLVRSFAAAHPGRRIVYENLGTNRGVSAARNRLLDLAQGDLFAFLDADDVWTPDHLESLTGCLAAGHALACSAIEVWDGNAACSLGTYAPSLVQLATARVELFSSSFIQTSSCVAITRATFERTGLFDETLRIGEDRDYWFRALARGETIGLSSKVTCRYTKHTGSSMTRTRRVAEDVVRFFEKHREATGIPPRLARRHLADALRSLGRLTRAEDPSGARRVFLRAWSERPLELDLPLRALTAHL